MRRIRWLVEIAAAPKLDFKVEKLTVYRDGVWAEFSVTNTTPKRIYLIPWFIDWPVRRMRIWDAEDREWQVPQFKGNVSYNDPDEFTSVLPKMAVRFRKRVSGIVDKPLELVGPGERPKELPKELSYAVWGWHSVFTHLTQDEEKRASVYATGGGKVPVTWVDENAPKSLRSLERLY